MKLHRKHRCPHRHRSYRTLAKCIWRRALWVSGEGEYAVLFRAQGLTVTLHAERAGAEAMWRILDRQCGAGRPRIERLAAPEEAVGASGRD